MSEKFKRLCSLLLAIVLIAALPVSVLVSCTPSDGGDTTADTTPDSTVPEETTAPAPTEYTLVKDGTANVRIVRHESLDISEQAVISAKRIYRQILSSSSVDVSFGSDYVPEGGSFDRNSLEILVGLTDYPESRQVAADLNYGDFIVTVVGNKIVVMGFSDDAMLKASNALAEIIALNAKDGNIVIPAEKIFRTGTSNKMMSAIPTYEGAKSVEHYETGNDSQEIIIRDTTLAEYDEYIKKLNAEGFSTYSQNTITENKFSICTGEKYVINAGYYDYEKSTRIIIEPSASATLPLSREESKFTPVTTSQITMIGLEYKKSDGTYASNGLSILIRLTDGRFIVVDGGFNKQADADLIVAQIKQQAATYSTPAKGYTIAAWIVTHSHSDHMGMIASKYSTLSSAKITVENFIVNFMSETERVKSIASSTFKGNWSDGEGSSYVSVLNAASALKSNVMVAHPGHVYYFADAKLEVLYTIDSYGPGPTNALNTTSLIIKMTFTDPATGKETVYMSTGDATGAGFDISAKMYGSYLKSDIVQVAHHGATTWGNSQGTINAYLLMAPSTVAWPRGLSSIDSSLKQTYNTPLFDNRNPNWRETYVAGDEGTIIIFPLPYTVGACKSAPYQKK